MILLLACSVELPQTAPGSQFIEPVVSSTNITSVLARCSSALHATDRSNS